MNKSIKVILAGILAVPILTLGLSFATPSYLVQQVGAVGECAVSGGVTAGANCSATDQQQETTLFGPGSAFQIITNAALFIIGAISVIVLIYGGILYTISGGDGTKVTTAKNTILYAVVGIVVAVLAYAVVNWVLTTLMPS